MGRAALELRPRTTLPSVAMVEPFQSVQRENETLPPISMFGGGMAERPNAPVLKTGRLIASGVQIPLPPPLLTSKSHPERSEGSEILRSAQNDRTSRTYRAE